MKIGSTVKLRAGPSPLMIVAEVMGWDLLVKWFVGDELKTERFPAELLQQVERFTQLAAGTLAIFERRVIGADCQPGAKPMLCWSDWEKVHDEPRPLPADHPANEVDRLRALLQVERESNLQKPPDDPLAGVSVMDTGKKP